MKSSQREPEFGKLALVTYAMVGLFLALAVGSYYYFISERRESEQASMADTRTVQIGAIWVPAYPGAALRPPEVAKRGDTIDGSMNFTTSDPAAQVVSFFENSLKRTGYQTTLAGNNVGGGTVQAVRQGGRMRVVVTVEAARDGADVAIRTLYRDDTK